MKTRQTRINRKSLGFSLIEVLVSMAVVALGLLAVLGVQTKLIDSSGETKAKAEAVALAQARLEEIRNYTHTYQTEADFNANFVGNRNAAEEVPGVNALYTISEARVVNGDTKQVTVNVTWTDRDGASQTVSLDTRLGWESPRAAAEEARANEDPAVTPPTGRARLGDGRVENWDPESPPEGTRRNGDNTYSYNDGSGDYKLVTTDGTVVLTLEDACLTDTCTDFVKISGRVWIDTTSQRQLDPGDVFVLASDAAYCQRYYTSGGQVYTVENGQSSTLATVSGNYKYFDYTCYLGGGWHGNIGILLANGLSQSDKICQGDPTRYVAGATYQDFRAPVIQARRAYRGMLYKRDPSQAGGRALDANGNVMYYSVGILDAARLPAQGQKGHDFIVSHMSVGNTEGSNCINESIMVRADSVGNPSSTDSSINDGDGRTLGSMFAGIPTDFVCLNPSNVDDRYDDSVYGVDNYCPFDPTDPPVSRHTIRGSISVSGTAPSAFGNSSDSNFLHTSDGLGNCTWSWNDSRSNATYSCNIYDWGTGWLGYVQINPNSGQISCNDSGSGDGATDQRYNFTSAVMANQSNKNFTCSTGEVVVISGDLGPAGTNKRITGVTITSTQASAMNCTYSNTNYRCTTDVYSVTPGTRWNGTITFTLSNGRICQNSTWSSSNGTVTFGSSNTSPRTATFANVPAGTYTLNLISPNGSSCP